MASILNNAEFLKMKKEVKEAYPSESWDWRVDHMKVNQIIAIWKNIQKRKNKPSRDSGQLSLFDLFPETMGGIAK